MLDSIYIVNRETEIFYILRQIYHSKIQGMQFLDF